MQTPLSPIITDIGSEALKKANFKGEKIYITDVALGNGYYHKSSKSTALTNELVRTKVTGGELLGLKQKQFNFQIELNEDLPNMDFDIHEIGFFLNTGELFAIISSPVKKIASKIMKAELILDIDFTITGSLADRITVSKKTIQLTNTLLSGEDIIKISTQKEFDLIFNKASKSKGSKFNYLLFEEMGTSVINKNTTILLSPIQKSFAKTRLKKNSSDKGNNTFNGRPAYLLKNPIKLESNICIMGLNTNDTIIVKKDADCNIIINGTKDHPVTGVKLSGWTFDGRGGIDGLGGSLITSKNGAAFSLDFAQDCTLNCQIINHNTRGKGGGIFGTENSKYITAENISNNYASIKGSGVYGCNKSSFRLRDCNIRSPFPNIAIINNSAILIDNIVTKLSNKKKNKRATETIKTQEAFQISTIEDIIEDPITLKIITPSLLKHFLNKIEEKTGKKINL